MTIHIVLNEAPSDEQVRKAIEMIGHYAGQAQMQRVAAGLMNNAPAIPSVPAVPAVATVPAPPVNQQSGVDAITPASFTGANGVTVELDKAGLPWDVRIHSGSKNINKDGSWKAKKNVADAEVATVTAELRNALANRTYLPGGAPVATPAVPDTNHPLIPPAVAAVPAVPTVPAVVPVAGGITFPTLMQKVAPLLAAKKLTQEQLQACAVAMGVPAFASLGTRPDLLDAADAYLSMVTAA